MKIKISEIVINEKERRTVDLKKAQELAESIKQIGLINPITLNGNNVLIAGAHRVKAHELLGIDEIEYQTKEYENKLLDKLAEIDENLIRNEIHYLDRGELLSERKSIYEEIHPYTKYGSNQFTRGVEENSTPRFSSNTAQLTGLHERIIAQEIQISREISKAGNEIKKRIKEADITKSDALSIAREINKVEREVNQFSFFKTDEEKKTQADKKIKEVVENKISEIETDRRKRESNKEIVVMKTPHVSYNSGENEWYTPKHIIDSAREIMGGIDLDPASNKLANETVRADKYYTISDNGLTKEWYGNVWLNPPYSQPDIALFSEKVAKLEFKQACVLVNNATETNWFQTMLIKSKAVCLIKGRIKFIDINGTPSGAPLQGQTILYFGSNTEKFIDKFSQIGICLQTTIIEVQ